MASMLAPRTPAFSAADDCTIDRCSVASGDGAGVDDLAHPCDQVLADARHRAADRDDRGIHQAHARRQHFADVATGLAHRLDRVDVPALDEIDDVVAVRRRARPARAARARWRAPKRGPRGIRGCRSWHGTSGPRATRTWPMSPAMPCAPRCSWPPEMTPAPMPVATLTNIRCSIAGHAGGALAERHDVDVVVDEHRRIEVLTHPARDVEAIPTRHDRRVDRADPVEYSTGPGHADADRGDVAWSRDRSPRAARAPSRASR